jgi:Arc/MetJ-type ribon-helix-helix transcriptional regulator
MAEKRGRPPKGRNMMNVAHRLPEELVARLDRHVERLVAQAPGMVFNRSDAVRVLLTQALDRIEAEESAEKPTKPRGK